jgi:ketosteroid isomerase-like protein
MKSSFAGGLVAWAVIGLCLFGATKAAAAADAETEREIRMLENQEVQAILAHDATTLERLWDKNFVVHNPEGRIVTAGASVRERPVLQNTRAAFVREVESIVVNGDVVFSMGSETVTAAAGATNAGVVTRRRYTNVWMRRDGTWKLVARHANKVCGKD